MNGVDLLRRENFTPTNANSSIPKKRYCFVGDFHENDVMSPSKAKKLLSIVKAERMSVLDAGATLFKRIQKKGSKEFPVELRAFALILSFYSSKAYEYVRKTFVNCLPHPVTLRKWLVYSC
ncbi:unnamed protein product [Larinioides sclopetarius]|uniref:THAP9-like helix-turn-helix domain-containing protein n=1 Tax=Larinioides sclopetarius TaxID=280406 RepID=A0AAV2BG25_9ARAC